MPCWPAAAAAVAPTGRSMRWKHRCMAGGPAGRRAVTAGTGVMTGAVVTLLTAAVAAVIVAAVIVAAVALTMTW